MIARNHVSGGNLSILQHSKAISSFMQGSAVFRDSLSDGESLLCLVLNRQNFAANWVDLPEDNAAGFNLEPNQLALSKFTMRHYAASKRT